MKTHGEFHHKGSLPFHGHCIHNDQLPKTHNFTMKGLFGAIVWIALWALIITTVVSHDIRARYSSHGVGTAMPVR